MHKPFPVLAFAALLSGGMALMLIGAVMLVGSDGVSSVEVLESAATGFVLYNMPLPPEPVYRLTFMQDWNQVQTTLVRSMSRNALFLYVALCLVLSRHQNPVLV